MNDMWLPEGKHWGLVISHKPQENAGSFAQGSGNRMVWHTTEGYGIDTMWTVLNNKRAAPHFLIDPSAGDSRVIQMIPLNLAGRALMNDSGDAHQTNRAGDHTVQVEIVDKAINAPNWNEYFYRDLAALAVLVEHRVHIKRHAKAFMKPERMSDTEFEQFEGHCGHVHVPDNDHWDPGKLSWPKLLNQMKEVDRRYK
jgi:hypothetical protein